MAKEIISSKSWRKVTSPPENFILLVFRSLRSATTFLIKEIKRVLKKDGYFIGSVPNALYIKNRLNSLRGHLDIELFHVHLYSLNSLNDLLEQYFYKTSIFPIAGGRNLAKFILRGLIKFFPSLCAIDFVFSCAGIK